MALVTPRASQGELGSFTSLPLGSKVFRPGTTPGTQGGGGCIELGVLRSVFVLLPANLRMELISLFYDHAVS